MGSAVKKSFTAFVFILQGKIDFGQLRKELIFIGYECLPMILALTAITSMIITINTAVELNNRGGRELVGSLIAVADLREILPLFIAFAIAARCGTAITAEIATMKVTEQIDALKMMRVDPLQYLMAPKLLAAILLSPFLVAIASFASIFAGVLVAKLAIGLEAVQFLDQAWKEISLKEYFYPLLKTVIFSVYAISMNVTYGLDCRGGAKDVGLATSQATATAMVGIIIIDGFLTPILYT